MFLGSINYSVISLEYFLVFLPVSIQCLEIFISIFLLTSLQFGSNPNWFRMYRNSSILHPDGHVAYFIFWRSIMAASEKLLRRGQGGLLEMVGKWTFGEI